MAYVINFHKFSSMSFILCFSLTYRPIIDYAHEKHTIYVGLLKRGLINLIIN